MDDMTDDQQEIFDMAARLAEIENDTNIAVLGKLTAFISDLEAMASALKFPPTHNSAARNTISEIISQMMYRRDTDLPNRIRMYEQALAQATAPLPFPGMPMPA